MHKAIISVKHDLLFGFCPTDSLKDKDVLKSCILWLQKISRAVKVTEKSGPSIWPRLGNSLWIILREKSPFGNLGKNSVIQSEMGITRCICVFHTQLEAS